MGVIWNNANPVTANDIFNQTDLSLTLVHKLLRELTDREIVFIADFRKPEVQGKHVRLFTSDLTAQDYLENSLLEGLEEYKISLPEFTSKLIDSVDDEDFIKGLELKLRNAREE